MFSAFGMFITPNPTDDNDRQTNASCVILVSYISYTSYMEADRVVVSDSCSSSSSSTSIFISHYHFHSLLSLRALCHRWIFDSTAVVHFIFLLEQEYSFLLLQLYDMYYGCMYGIPIYNSAAAQQQRGAVYSSIPTALLASPVQQTAVLLDCRSPVIRTKHQDYMKPIYN